MTEAVFRERVLELARRAEHVLGRQHDFPTAEPLFEQVLVLAAAEPQHRGALCAALVELLVAQDGPVELVEYCAHALRWPELKLAFEKLLADAHDRRNRDALVRLLGAFEDNWDQRDIYRRWGSS